MSTPAKVRQIAPEFSGDNPDKGGITDTVLQAWIDDAVIELGDNAEERFGKRYPRIVALAAAHLLAVSRQGLSEDRRGAGGLGLVGALASFGSGGMTFGTRDMTAGAPPELRAKWGATRFGVEIIGAYLETEEAAENAIPDFIIPSF